MDVQSAPAAFPEWMGPNLSAADDSGIASTADLQLAQDAFEHYWNGQYRWWRRENRAGRRRAHYRRLRVPKIRPPSIDASDPGAPPLDLSAQRYRWRQSTREDSDNLQRYMTQIQNGDFNVMPYMRPLGFRLLKILGKGGFGIACLFEMTDVNRQKHQIVVKAGTGNDLQRERTYLRVGG